MCLFAYKERTSKKKAIKQTLLTFKPNGMLICIYSAGDWEDDWEDEDQSRHCVSAVQNGSQRPFTLCFYFNSYHCTWEQWFSLLAQEWLEGGLTVENNFGVTSHLQCSTKHLACNIKRLCVHIPAFILWSLLSRTCDTSSSPTRRTAQNKVESKPDTYHNGQTVSHFQLGYWIPCVPQEAI